MSWLCISCETVNYGSDFRCIVCGTERYYAHQEVQSLLENHPEYQTLKEQNKKLTQQNKWLQTRNRNLTQENKQLKEILATLEQKNAKNILDASRQEKKQESNHEFDLLKERITSYCYSKNQSLQEKIIWGELIAILSTFWAIFWATR